MILGRASFFSVALILSPVAHAAIPESDQARPTSSPSSQPTDPVALREMQVHFLIASEYYKEGNFQAAIDEWKQVLRIQPNHALAREKIEKAKERMNSSVGR